MARLSGLVSVYGPCKFCHSPPNAFWLILTFNSRGSGLILLFGPHTHPAVIAVCVGVMGCGIGFTFQPTLVALQAHSTKSQRAVVISDRNFFRCMGGACDLAISAALLQATLRSNLPSELSYLAKSSYSLPDRSSVTAAEWSQILFAYSKASHSVFILQVPLIGVCFLASALVRDRGLERPKEPEEIEEEKRKAEAERDAEANVPESSSPEDEHTAGKTVEKRPSISTLAPSTNPPSRAEPSSSSDPKPDGFHPEKTVGTGASMSTLVGPSKPPSRVGSNLPDVGEKNTTDSK